ncbi:MAG: cbb3-type cytochrome oxidase assembly protein CcoS [Bacteroidota bacterium]|jgi:cbb3-type cytochrome oxidase maturation protein
MSVMYILIGCSLLMAIGFLIAFIWFVKSGQMDDVYTPSVRILFDDIENKTTNSNKNEPIKND